MKCRKCKKEYEKWISIDGIENNLCQECNEQSWADFEKEHEPDLQKIKEIQTKGHSHHCACRQVWGDGECECNRNDRGMTAKEAGFKFDLEGVQEMVETIKTVTVYIPK